MPDEYEALAALLADEPRTNYDGWGCSLSHRAIPSKRYLSQQGCAVKWVELNAETYVSRTTIFDEIDECG